MKRKFLSLSFALWVFFFLSTPSPAVNQPASSPSQSETVIIVNPLENRLFLVRDGKIVKQYPIALGKPQTPTPTGEWKVINKYKNWGKWFGTRWIGLNVPWGIYGIHGTNRPDSIGWDVSHGCIRMHNRHIEELYEHVTLGTKVIILGHVLGELYSDPRRLAEGDIGADVMLVQYRLRSAGYYHGPCDGRFGRGTRQAMMKFEKDHHLPVDGVVGLFDYIHLGLLE